MRGDTNIQCVAVCHQHFLSKVYFKKLIFFVLKVVAALPEDMRPGPTPYGLPGELLICAATVGFFAFFLFLWRSFRSVSNQCCIVRECSFCLQLEQVI